MVEPHHPDAHESAPAHASGNRRGSDSGSGSSTDRSSSTGVGSGRANLWAAGPRSGFGLGSAFGVALRVDWSLLIIFALILFELGVAVFPRWHPQWTTTLTWTMALATAVLFFASILVHELSHALVARAQGIPVKDITLFLFGGVTQLEAEPASPKAEFWMAIVGPLMSIMIGLLATLGGAALVGAPLREAIDVADPAAIEAAFADASPLATLLLWLGPINLLLGVFNIIPGFPLDGGRVLRSILWATSKDLRKATRWASRVGQVFAWCLMAWGVFNFFAGVWASALWLILIGWFLNNAARMSYQQLVIRKALEDVPVYQLMRSMRSTVPPGLSVETFVREFALTSEQQVFPVVAMDDPDAGLLGTVSAQQIHVVDKDAWATTRVDQIMIPRAKLPILPPNAGAERALDELSRSDIDQVVVIDQGRLLGLVRREDVARWLSIHDWVLAPQS
jgi:Zn-dependent protease/CBS domain-containing protein